MAYAESGNRERDYLTAILATFLQCHTFFSVLSAMYFVSKKHEEYRYSSYAAGLFNLDTYVLEMYIYTASQNCMNF